MNLTIFIGSLAAFLCSIGNIPQIIKGYITKRLDDVSTLFMIIIATGLTLWVIYGILRKDLILIIANLVGISLYLITMIMKYYYIYKRDNSKSENLLNQK